MSKQKSLILDRQRELQNEGWDWDVIVDHGVDPHTGHETPRHFYVKAEVCRIIANRSGRFVCEANHPERGTADVIDLRYDEPKAVIYEIETGLTREQEVSKARQYAGPCIRETFCIDPLEAPSDLDELEQWVREEMQ